MTEVVSPEITSEQAAALDALEKVFGPVDPLLHNVKSDEYLKSAYGYKHWISRSLKEALVFWGQYKHAQSVDWDAEIRRRIDEEELARAERSDRVRDNVVGGAFNQLMSRARASKIVSSLQYEEEADYWNLIAYGEKEIELFSMSYMLLDVQVVTVLGNETVLTDNVKTISGNSAPRQQLKGLDTVLKWLDDQDG
jgi:hypothetical protein